MMNLKEIERIASEFEKKLGLDEPGDELIEKAEESVAQPQEAVAGEENLGETLDKSIEEEKKDTEVPEECLAAGEEDDCEIASAEKCIASLKQLVKIAKTVKASDMPASKKEEVLGKIQTASQKILNAAKGGKGDDKGEKGETHTNQSLKKKDTSVTSVSLKRGITPASIAKLQKNPSATMKRIFEKAGKTMEVNIPVNRMTATMFINLLNALEEALAEID